MSWEFAPHICHSLPVDLRAINCQSGTCEVSSAKDAIRNCLTENELYNPVSLARPLLQDSSIENSRYTPTGAGDGPAGRRSVGLLIEREETKRGKAVGL